MYAPRPELIRFICIFVAYRSYHTIIVVLQSIYVPGLPSFILLALFKGASSVDVEDGGMDVSLQGQHSFWLKTEMVFHVLFGVRCL